MGKILLGKNKSKRGVSENNSVTLQLVNNERLLPYQGVINDIDQYEVYNNEKDKCNKYRLLLTLNPICTNVLFNHLTEVVYKHSTNESEDILIDSNGVDVSVYTEDLKCIEPCNINKINRKQVIRDTEYSHPSLGNLEYRPGIDIFNNHLLRKDDFVVVNKRSNLPNELLEKDEISTINEWKYNGGGVIEKDIVYGRNYFKFSSFKLFNNEIPTNTKEFIFNSNKKTLNFQFPRIEKIEKWNGNEYIDYDIDMVNSFFRYRVYVNYSESDPIDEDKLIFAFEPESYKNMNSYGFSEEKNISIAQENWEKPIYIAIFCSIQVNDNTPKMRITFDASTLSFQNNFNSKNIFYIKNIDDTFNTIYDYLRDSSGNIIKEYDFNVKNVNIDDGDIAIKPEKKEVRLYQMNKILSFEESINKNLLEKNGWFGFINSQTIDIANYKDMSINKCINNRNDCQFIDMYPDRTLFSFQPKINRYKNNKIEKNWECLITYPYKKYKDENSKLFHNNSIKIDKNKINVFIRNGEKVVIFKSPVKHNLLENSIVRLIFGDKSEKISVYEIGDINSENIDICFSVKYVDIINKFDDIFDGSDNIDANIETVAFNKVENGIDCEYYFREHKVIPNFKFAPEDVNSKRQDEIDGYIDSLLEHKQHYINNKVNKLSFAENIYSDNLVEVMFTDDVEVNRLTNTMGTPLTEIYLTIIKTNEKVNDNGNEKYISPFGKITAGLDLNDSENNYNVHKIHNIDIDNSLLRINKSPLSIGDEITSNDTTFIGDLVEYSPSNFKETVIEDIFYRFNTTQRENSFDDGNLYYDEIDGENLSEPNTKIYNGFENNSQYPANLNPEGYYYKAHYPIKINNLSGILSSGYDRIIIYKNNKDVSPIIDNNKITFIVNDITYIQYADAVYLKNKENMKKNGYVSDIDIKEGKITVDFENLENVDEDSISTYKLFKVNLEIPSYAYEYKDLSGRYVWRNILSKSDVTNDNEINNIIFTNNALYIEKHFNFFLKRQDPNGNYGLKYTKENSNGHKLYNFVVDGKKKDTTKYEYTTDIKWRTC